MLKIGKIIFFISVAFCVLNYALAEVKAGVDKTVVALDDTVKYTIEITGNEPNPGLPELTNLRVISTYQSSNISIINGQASTSQTFTYILQPEKVGKARIGSIEITVTKAEGKRVQSHSQPPSRFPSIWEDFDEFFSSPFPRFLQPQVVRDPIKIDLKASRTTAYVNQQIILTFTFYRRINLFQPPQYNPPDTTGFWAINLPTEKNLREVELNGVKYLAQDFKTALFPTSPGDFTIGPATLVAQVDPFAQAQTIKTAPIKIHVLPLPEEGKPANFSGAVGDYQMQVWLKQNKVERGQPVQITAKIWGSGNIQTISEPVCALPKEFKKLSASGKEDLIKGNNGVSGSKTFDIVLIPLKEGKYVLPPFEFSYFDPLKREYKTIKSQALDLTILPSSVPLPKEYEEELAEKNTVEPVAIVIPWRKIGAGILNILLSIYFWLPVLIVLFIISVIFIYKRYQEKLAADPVRLRQRKALKVARSRLKKAFDLLKHNKLKEFLGEIFNATAKYLGDKYGFSAAGMTTDSLKDILSKRGLSTAVQEELENFVTECDLLRFTPSSLSKERAEQLAQLAEKLIVTIERG